MERFRNTTRESDKAAGWESEAKFGLDNLIAAKATADVDMLDAIPEAANKGSIGQSVMRIVKAAALKTRAPPSDTSRQPDAKKAKVDKTDNKYKLTL
jgi:hypothetical protein